ncbi:UNVERIFIED_CONTAM: hypothetical protein HDU68_003209 [Siphonaria sp. JEL0065]|nr:hypothetical protein HDU68_003209 [Siphonaria sp. JEL0065]
MKLTTVIASIALAAQCAYAQDYSEWTVAQMSAAMNAGTLTSVQLTQFYLNRIALYNPKLNAVIETDPQALAWAAWSDKLRAVCKTNNSCNQLLGIPILLKDNIATRDLMQSTAGSWALYGSVPSKDAFVVDKLRKAGAVLLGKANLSEFANWRDAMAIPSGWSGRGGQTINPYDPNAFVCGSSSGSAVAASANLAAITLGTETDGSIICPSVFNGVVGLKPTVGLVSRSGVIPISATQDSVGPITRTVADAAYLLDVIAGTDASDAATVNADIKRPKQTYASYLSPAFVSGQPLPPYLTGMRIGFDVSLQFDPRMGLITGLFGSPYAFNGTMVPLNFTNVDLDNGNSEVLILQTEFKAGLNSYLSSLQYTPVKKLNDLIQVTAADKRENIYGYADWLLSQNTSLNDAAYIAAKKFQANNVKAIDSLFAANKIDVFIGDSFDLSHGAALAGYPVLTVPACTTKQGPAKNIDNSTGLPYYIGFTGLPYSEQNIIKVASAYENIKNTFFGGRATPPGFGF